MGAFIVNIHVRTQDRARLLRAVSEMAPEGCWITAPQNGWSTIYEEQASGQDDARIRRLGTDLSARLDTTAAAFLIHDSDFLCYWLFEQGKIVDAFNSCPDYFQDDDSDGADAATSQGQPQVLLRFCKTGSKLSDVQRLLQSEAVFAEDQLQQLARLLGIDEARALTDYRDLNEASAQELQAEFIGAGRPPRSKLFGGGRSTIKFPAADSFGDEEEEENEDDETGRQTRGPAGAVTNQLAQLMGLAGATQAPAPLVAELVQAAADGKVSELERLVSAGADLEGTAPMKGSATGQSSLSARMLAGGGIALPVTPLLAAIAHKRVDAARRLIELGADVHGQHPLFGSPLHNAVSAGSPELVRLVLDGGAEVNQRNKQGQTPLQALQAVRTMLRQLDSLRGLGGPMFKQIESELNRLMDAGGWDECESLLRAQGGS